MPASAHKQTSGIWKKTLPGSGESEKNASVREFLKLDDEFHGYFFHRTGKRVLLQSCAKQCGTLQPHPPSFLHGREYVGNSIAQHEEIIQLIREKDKAGIQQAIKKHLMKIEQDEIELKRKYASLFVGEIKPMEGIESIWSADFLDSISDI